MGSRKRGIANAFRNKTRAFSIIVILGLGIGLAFSMLAANQAMANKVKQVQAQAGTTFDIAPGSQKMLGDLPYEYIEKVSTVSNVANVTANTRLTGAHPKFPDSIEADGSLLKTVSTNITAFKQIYANSSELSETFVYFQLADKPIDFLGNSPTIISGTGNFSSPDAAEAILSNDTAKDNALQVGSTFTIQNKKVTVVGIYESISDLLTPNEFIPTGFGKSISNSEERHTSTIKVTANNLDNVGQIEADIKKLLGAQNVKFFSASQDSRDAIESLGSVKDISFISFLGSLVAASAIIFLMMIIIVRERKQEIGVLKAIGAPNQKINSQFAFESLSLVAWSAFLGVTLAIFNSQNIINSLLNNQEISASPQNNIINDGVPQDVIDRGNAELEKAGLLSTNAESPLDIIGNVDSAINLQTFVTGISAIALIAIIGSIVPAWLTTKIRPIEALRGE